MSNAKRPLSQRLFDDNNAFFRIMGVAGDLILLNILGVLACIPVITAGAGFAAMNRVLVNMLEDKPVRIVRDFWQAFKHNFKPATALWLICLMVIIIARVDMWALASAQFTSLDTAIRVIALAALFAIGLIVGAIAYYGFMHIALFDRTFGTQLRYAAWSAFALLPRTIVVLIILVVCGLLVGQFFVYAVPVLLLFGLSVPLGACAWITHSAIARIVYPHE